MTVTRSDYGDRGTQSAVQDELAWSPDLDDAGIGVAVQDGTVRLSGEVRTLAEKHAASLAALSVKGVSTVVDDVTVHRPTTWSITELDIGREVEHALTWAADVPASVQAEIEGHRVTLTGAVDWHFQREAAQRAVFYLRGVHMVDNHISLSDRPAGTETEVSIREALERNAGVDADSVTVHVVGTRVTLNGDVRSWSEKQQAGRAAWASPNITDVENRLYVTTD